MPAKKTIVLKNPLPVMDEREGRQHIRIGAITKVELRFFGWYYVTEITDEDYIKYHYEIRPHFIKVADSNEQVNYKEIVKGLIIRSDLAEAQKELKDEIFAQTAPELTPYTSYCYVDCPWCHSLRVELYPAHELIIHNEKAIGTEKICSECFVKYEKEWKAKGYRPILTEESRRAYARREQERNERIAKEIAAEQHEQE